MYFKKVTRLTFLSGLVFFIFQVGDIDLFITNHSNRETSIDKIIHEIDIDTLTDWLISYINQECYLWVFFLFFFWLTA